MGVNVSFIQMQYLKHDWPDLTPFRLIAAYCNMLKIVSWVKYCDNIISWGVWGFPPLLGMWRHWAQTCSIHLLVGEVESDCHPKKEFLIRFDNACHYCLVTYYRCNLYWMYCIVLYRFALRSTVSYFIAFYCFIYYFKHICILQL